MIAQVRVRGRRSWARLIVGTRQWASVSDCWLRPCGVLRHGARNRLESINGAVTRTRLPALRTLPPARGGRPAPWPRQTPRSLLSCKRRTSYARSGSLERSVMSFGSATAVNGKTEPYGSSPVSPSVETSQKGVTHSVALRRSFWPWENFEDPLPPKAEIKDGWPTTVVTA